VLPLRIGPLQDEVPSKISTAGAQPALHFGVGQFHELLIDDVIVLIQPWYNFFTNGHRLLFSQHFRKWELISLNQARS